jgi:predicted phosphodiesterase
LSRPKLFVCGHSHILKVMPDRALGCLVVNPGAAGVQGWQVVRTLVTLTLDNGNITHAQVIELAK